MKREFLKQQIPGITEEQINAILNENGNDLADLRSTISRHETTINTLTTERDGYKTQLADRDKDIKELQGKAKGNEDLTKQLGELQTKYDTDTKALQKKLDRSGLCQCPVRFQSRQARCDRRVQGEGLQARRGWQVRGSRELHCPAQEG